MNRFLTYSMLLLCSACAYTVVNPLPEDDDSTEGYRFYEPMPVLLVGCTRIELGFVPDYSRGYSVQPRAWLAKNDFEIKLDNAMLEEATSDLDSTALLTFLQTVGSEAIEGAEKLAALSGDVTGVVSRREAHLYRFVYDEKGRFEELDDLGKISDCPAPGGSGGGKGRATEGKPRS
jgi:Txe/YoeB family toxin of Txe-Axe toxin-antitoxin module